MNEQSGSRRSFLRLAALGTLNLPVLTSRAQTVERKTPAAPYPHEPSPTGKTSLANFWSRAGLLRRDIRPNMDGKASAPRPSAGPGDQAGDGRPLADAFGRSAVYVWHSDARGEYSVYGVNDASYLRGIGVTGPDGRVSFKSVYPGTYTGREPHVHFEVYPSLESMQRPQACQLRSRILFPESVSREVYKSNLVYRPSLKTFEGLVFGRPGATAASPDRHPGRAGQRRCPQGRAGQHFHTCQDLTGFSPEPSAGVPAGAPVIFCFNYRALNSYREAVKAIARAKRSAGRAGSWTQHPVPAAGGGCRARA